MSDTPRTDDAYAFANAVQTREQSQNVMRNCGRELERELDAALKECGSANEQIRTLKIQLRAADTALNEQAAEIEQANAALGDWRSAMAAHMSVCGNDPIPVHRTYCSRCAECGKETK